MKLSRTVAYALQATLQLAQAPTDQPTPCSRLASEGQMPERFLLQILRSLVTHGILHSTRGVDGGYALKRPADQISLLDIIEAIDGPLATNVSDHSGLAAACGENLQRLLDGVIQSVRGRLDAIKIAQLVEIDPPMPGAAP